MILFNYQLKILQLNEKQGANMNKITVRQLAEKLKLEIVAGEKGLD